MFIKRAYLFGIPGNEYLLRTRIDLGMNDRVNDMNILIVGLNFKAPHMLTQAKQYIERSTVGNTKV